MEDSRAQTIGIPGAYDYGCQRISWVDNLITNWMGDDGFIKNLNGTLKRFNIVGDTHWMKGKVTKKYIVNPYRMRQSRMWAEAPSRPTSSGHWEFGTAHSTGLSSCPTPADFAGDQFRCSPAPA